MNMTRKFGLVVAFLVVALTTFAISLQRVEAQRTAYLANYFTGGPQQVTISTRAGQVLSVLDVPAGIEVSIHLSKGEHSLPQSIGAGPATFRGDVTIHTRPRSELVEGQGSLNQMMAAPFRLDAQDVVVVAARKP
jgi:hypothetical protein